MASIRPPYHLKRYTNKFSSLIYRDRGRFVIPQLGVKFHPNDKMNTVDKVEEVAVDVVRACNSFAITGEALSKAMLCIKSGQNKTEALAAIEEAMQERNRSPVIELADPVALDAVG